MSRAKPKFVWVCRAGQQLAAAFDNEAAADSFCHEMNGSDRAAVAEAAKQGLKKSRVYYTWEAISISRTLDS